MTIYSQISSEDKWLQPPNPKLSLHRLCSRFIFVVLNKINPVWEETKMNSWLTIDTGQKMCLNKLTFSFLSPPERKTRAWTSASWTSSASRTSRRTPSSSFASTSPMSRSSFTSTSTYSLGNRWRPTSTFKLSLNSKTVSWALESVLESTLYAFLPLLLPHFHLNGDNMF